MWRVTVSLVLVYTSACADLSAYPEGCGNSIVEAGEDCDGDFTPGTTCRAPGVASACRFDCSDGRPCPDGYGCGLDAICRRPSGTFSAGDPIEGAAYQLEVADVDADGRRDLVRYAPESFALELFATSRTLVAAPEVGGQHVTVAVADVTGDGRAEVAASRWIDGALSVFRVEADRTLKPVVYSSQPIPEARLIVMDAVPPSTVDEVVFVLDDSVAVQIGSQSIAIAAATAPVATVVGLAAGDFLEDGSAVCEELALARLGAPQVEVHAPCRAGPASGVANSLDADHLSLPSIALPGGSPVGDGKPALLAGDVNADGRRDLVISTVRGSHVAFAVGDGTFHSIGDSVPMLGGDGMASPLLVDQLLEDGTSSGLQVLYEMPLEIGDFNADGAADYVLSFRLLVSDRSGGVLRHRGADIQYTSRALVGDFNDNSRLDLVTVLGFDPSVSDGIRFHDGAGDGTFMVTDLATPEQVLALVGGDFDGDFVDDIVVAGGPPGQSRDVPGALSVAFGKNVGPPEAPRAIGTFDSIVQLVAGRALSGDAADDLLVTVRNGDGGLTVATLAGSPSRELLSPFVLPGPGGPDTLSIGPLAVLRAPGQPRALAGVSFAATFPDGERRTNGPATWLLRFDEDAHIAAAREPLSTDVYGTGGALDLDGDGIDEIVVLQDEVTVFRLGGDAYVAPPAGVFEPPYFYGPVLVDDVDGDGRGDLTAWTDNGSLAVIWNDGVGVLDPDRAAVLALPFPAPPPGPEAEAPVALARAWIQADADRELELFVVTPEGGVLWQIEGRAFVGSRVVDASLFAHAVAAGDFDGDGIDDIAVGDDLGHRVLWGTPEPP